MPVSLFYLYYEENDADALAIWIRHLCERLSLRGRIRVAGEGVNGTLGGTNSAVEEFEAALCERVGTNIDYKRSPGNANAFNTLIVRVVDELVTLGVPRTQAPLSLTAPHLSPDAFLAEARARTPRTVLLDTRNAYESAIGTPPTAHPPAHPPPRGSTNDTHRSFPRRHASKTRAFLNYPPFTRMRTILQGRRILLYCTGGIRCETASALLIQGGATDVAQLHGGIHRFLERFPDGGGEYHGRNLVFDGRHAIDAVGSPVVGRCVVCDAECDCYARGTRCTRCRARVLICKDECEAVFYDTASHGTCDVCRNGYKGTVKAVKTRRKRRERLAHARLT
eukprot:IDg21569t1